ncbi:MAG: FadR/GntR family transcriptional regulator, partial [Fusobacteriaceae bacterium]
MKINITNKSDIVVDFIQNKIASKEWKEEEKIPSESKLCEELNLSRVPIRAAIDRLVALEMLEKKNGGRTYVKKASIASYFNSLNSFLMLDDVNFEQIMEFRSIIEVSAISIFIKNANNSELKELENTYNLMILNQENRNFYFYDYEFHKIIARGSKNKIIEKIYEILFSLLDKHHSFLFEKLGPSGGIKDHKLILEALKNRDQEL